MAFQISIKDAPPKGRGVFAQKDFSPGEVIEICPLLILDNHDYLLLDQTILENYMYDWFGDACLPLGYGLLYNHSFSPNAEYAFDKPNATLRFIAIKPIRRDEEILVNYNGDPSDTSALDGFDF